MINIKNVLPMKFVSVLYQSNIISNNLKCLLDYKIRTYQETMYRRHNNLPVSSFRMLGIIA